MCAPCCRIQCKFAVNIACTFCLCASVICSCYLCRTAHLYLSISRCWWFKHGVLYQCMWFVCPDFLFWGCASILGWPSFGLSDCWIDAWPSTGLNVIKNCCLLLLRKILQHYFDSPSPLLLFPPSPYVPPTPPPTSPSQTHSSSLPHRKHRCALGNQFHLSFLKICSFWKLKYLCKKMYCQN